MKSKFAFAFPLFLALIAGLVAPVSASARGRVHVFVYFGAQPAYYYYQPAPTYYYAPSPAYYYHQPAPTYYRYRWAPRRQWRRYDGDERRERDGDRGRHRGWYKHRDEDDD